MTFVFRNTTLERFFDAETQFSGYGDISIIPIADEYVWFYLQPISADIDAVAKEITQFGDLLAIVLSQISTEKQIYAFTMVELFATHTVLENQNLRFAITEYNQRLIQLSQQYSNLKIIDFEIFTNQYTQNELLDWKYYFMSQMGLNPRLAADFKVWYMLQKQAVALKRKKCLVLDLDNTLWGGVLGEDGIEGIQLGGDYPGKAYLFFQKQIKILQQQGVILAICSKNNIADVEELWKKHPDCVLKKEDFACLKINWNNKADNLRQIATELNIGLDSFVFIDDNPTERELIKQECPEVTVVDYPTKPYELPLFCKIISEKYFATYTLTDEDKTKTEQYHANAKRCELQTHFTNLDDYIKSLEIKIEVSLVTKITLARAAQMTQKTNQFNLTTRRYTEADIQKLLNENAVAYTLSVSDKFGDSGISGLSIIKINGEEAEFDTLLLSCRVLGKRIEFNFVEKVIENLKNQGIKKIKAEYISTAKNSQTAHFYEDCRFSLMQDLGTKKIYQYDI